MITSCKSAFFHTLEQKLRRSIALDAWWVKGRQTEFDPSVTKFRRSPERRPQLPASWDQSERTHKAGDALHLACALAAQAAGMVTLDAVLAKNSKRCKPKTVAL